MLRVVSIFTSISGEVGGFPQGSMTQFVRFGGCNLCCQYCDTANTQPMDSGQEMEVGDIAQILLQRGIKNVILTGGEPLLQDRKELATLTRLLHEKGYRFSIETNGTIRVPFALRPTCSFVMDYKMDMPELMQDERFLSLGTNDFVKFPIPDRQTLMMAIEIQRRLYQRGCVAKFAYSPIFDRAGDTEIAFNQTACSQACLSIINALSECRMDAILNLQIHKIINAE